MHRRQFLILAAVLAIAACDSVPRQSTPAEAGFTSDRIDVATRGSGPDIILIPGLAAHRDVWADVADSLDDRYRLHVLQVNGFGGLEPGANADGPVVVPVAEEVARYIRDMRLERPAIIGHSMGGAIGMMVAARHPDAVGRLMVVDEAPFLGAAFSPPGSTPETIGRIADETRAGILATPAGGTGNLEQMIQTMTRSEAARSRLLRYAADSHRATVANAMHELIVTDLRPELPNIAAPVTVLYVIPSNIPVSPEEFERLMQLSFSGAKGARLVRINDSNHYIQIDTPGRFVAEVGVFMRFSELSALHRPSSDIRVFSNVWTQ